MARKGITQTTHKGTHAVLMSVSKAALADLVIDLLRQRDGEALDASALEEWVRAALEPILRARGDRRL